MTPEVSSKRERNRLDRRDAIVAVARRLFLEDGYAATTMSAVSEALGGSKATLWAHFRSKEDLFAEVIDRMIEELASRLESILGQGPVSRGALREFAEQFLERMFEPESTRLYRVVIAEGARFPELGAMFFARGPARIMARLEAWFGTGHPPADAARLAQVTCAALVGFRSNRLLRDEKLDRPAIRRFVGELIDTLGIG